MAKIELKGKLYKIEKAFTSKQKPIVYLYLLESANIDQFGDKIGFDNYYKITVNDVQKNPAESFDTLFNQPVYASVFLNGFEYTKKEGGTDVMTTLALNKIMSAEQWKREQALEKEKADQYRQYTETEQERYYRENGK